MVYTFDGRVRYSETNERHMLRPDAILDYVQDCSTFQSESTGMTMDSLREQNLVWVVNFWQIVFERPLKLMDRIKIGTKPIAFKGCIGHRNFWIENEAGEYAIKCHSVWVLITLDGKPGWVTKEMKEAYGLEEPLEMNYADRKIPIPKDSEEGVEMTEAEPIPVTGIYLDANHHVNNGWYVRLALALTNHLNTDLRELRAEYRKSALEGDVMIPKIYRKENETIVVFETTDHNVYAVIQLFH